MRLSVPSCTEKDNPARLLFSYTYLHFVFEQVNKVMKKENKVVHSDVVSIVPMLSRLLIKNYKVISHVRAFDLRENDVCKNHVGKGGWHCFRPAHRRSKDQCRTV